LKYVLEDHVFLNYPPAKVEVVVEVETLLCGMLGSIFVTLAQDLKKLER
jgi:hypothetical protein